MGVATMGLQTVELLVRLDCSGCETKIRKHISKLGGVDIVEIDSAMNKVTVTGYIDRTTVLRAVRRAGKRAEFWQDAFSYVNGSGLDHQLLRPRCLADPDPDPDSSAVASSPYFQHHAFRRSYNYEKHGYNHRAGSDGPPQYDPASTLFSDENANAYCSIM